MEGNPNEEKPKRKYYQEDVRYYVREDGIFIPVYTRARPKVEPPEEKVKEKPFNVDSYEIFKHENEYVYSSEEPFTTDDEIMDDDDDDDDLGYLGLEEEKVNSETDDSSDEVTDADDEYESQESISDTSESEPCWDEYDSEEKKDSEVSEKDPEEIEDLDIKNLKPLMDDLLNVHRERPMPKKWKPNPYMSTLVYRDKITESDKEEMQYQKELNKIKTDDLQMPSDEDDKNYVHPKHGDINYMGEIPCDPNTPFVPWWKHEEEIYGNYDDINECETWPERNYQSDFVTDTSELYSTVTEVDDEDLEPLPSELEYPIIKPEEYMEPIEMNAGDHQYQKFPENQPQVRTWYDWHGDQYMDMKNAQGEWLTVEKIHEVYPLPKPKHSEHYWKKKGEEEGYYPKKCSPYEYPPDEDGYYHYCPGYNHIPGTENWSFYDNIKDEELEEKDKKEEEEEEEEEGKDGDDEEFDDKNKSKEKDELSRWQDYVTQSLRPKGSSEETRGDSKSSQDESQRTKKTQGSHPTVQGLDIEKPKQDLSPEGDKKSRNGNVVEPCGSKNVGSKDFSGTHSQPMENREIDSNKSVSNNFNDNNKSKSKQKEQENHTDNFSIDKGVDTRKGDDDSDSSDEGGDDNETPATTTIRKPSSSSTTSGSKAEPSKTSVTPNSLDKSKESDGPVGKKVSNSLVDSTVKCNKLPSADSKIDNNSTMNNKFLGLNFVQHVEENVSTPNNYVFRTIPGVLEKNEVPVFPYLQNTCSLNNMREKRILIH